MNQHDRALGLLELAVDDLKPATLLASSLEIRDSTVGFHCHQCGEKSLKAVLAEADIDYPKTHNLLVLVNLLKPSGREPQIPVQDLAMLNPYGVTLRYDIALSSGLDRDSALQFARAVHLWAEEQVRASELP